MIDFVKQAGKRIQLTQVEQSDMKLEKDATKLDDLSAMIAMALLMAIHEHEMGFLTTPILALFEMTHEQVEALWDE